ncbi:MAG: hypothetical protein RLZZ563_476 [Pseudomonadota bacterium]
MGRAAADIGGIAAEQLNQARVAEMQAQQAVQRHAGQERGPQARLAQGGAGDGGAVGAGGLHHRGVEGIKQPLGQGVKAQKGRRLARAAKGADRLGIGVGVRGQVQRAAARPPVPRQHGLGNQADVIVKFFAVQGKERVKHMAHGQNRWPCIHRACCAGQGAGLAAGGRSRIHHSDLQAKRRQTDGRGQPAHAGADDDCLLGLAVCGFVHPPKSSRALETVYSELQ